MKDLVARALTEIAAPWTVNIASCLILGFAIGHPGWGAFVALFAGVLPMALIVWGMVRDRIGNHHVTEHSERHGLIGAILGLVLVALVVQLVAQGPTEMIALTCAGLVTLVGIGFWTSGVDVKALSLPLESGHRISCGECERSRCGQSSFELDRRQITQRGMTPSPVVVRQPLEQFQTRPRLRRRGLAMQPFTLQTLKERLRQGIVVT